MISTLKKLLLTCLVSGQSFLVTAQYYIHFDKDGRIEKVTTIATTLKGYPSVFSKKELHFETSNVKVLESPFWKNLDDIWKTLSSGPFQNPREDVAINIQNVVRGALITPLPALLGTPSKGAVKYNPSNLTLPIIPATSAEVYTIETTEYDRELNKAVPRPTLNFDGRDRIEYKLIRNKLDNDIIQKHLEKTAPNFKGWPVAYDELLLELRQKFRNQGWGIDAVMARDSLRHTTGPMRPFNASILTNLDSLTHPIELTDSFYMDVLKNNQQWIDAWLWYTGGQVRLNPFPYADPAKLVERADREINELNSEISAMANREVSLDEGGQKDRLAFLLSRLVTLKQTREDLGKEKDDYTKWLAKLSVKSEVVYSGVWHGSDADEIRWLHQFDAARDFRFMNTSGSLPNMVANQDQTVVYTHNLGTEDKITVSSALTPFQPKSGIETTADAIAIELAKAVGGSSSIQGLAQLVAGLSASNATKPSPFPTGLLDEIQKVSMIIGKGSSTNNEFLSDISLLDLRNYVQREVRYSSFSYAQIKSDPNVLRVLTDSIKAALARYKVNLDAAKISKNTQAEGIINSDINLAEALIEVVSSLQITNKAKALILMYAVFGISDQVAYQELIQSYADSKQNLIWLSAQTVPILSLSLKPDEKPIYRTHAEFPEKKVAIESSNKVAYTLTLNEKTPVARQTYSKYFTSRFMPSFGIVYVPGQRSALRFDETTGQFKPLEKDFDHIEALVGAKYYPWKTNPARTAKTTKLLRKAFNWKTNLSRGSNFLNTFYVSGGLGVRRQLLRNYYLGLGVDIIPGLSIQGGSNFVFQKQYELENAKIKSETEVLKPFGYVGLGLDLGLVTNLIKILIP